ncbi:MAG TPA: oligoendopeptidase F [Planctomycetia bacterium]|nr:oligoendopeptidase F [Planctomycetia bacterium]
MNAAKMLPARRDVPVADTWDLSTLFASDDAWNAAFADWSGKIDGYSRFQGKLGESAALLAECLAFDAEFERLGEAVGTYAFLKDSEDSAAGQYQAMKAKYVGASSRAGQAASYLRPEVLAIPDETYARFVADPVLADFKLALERLRRYRPHVLPAEQERLLAMQMEMAQTARLAFGQLTNADMKFGTIEIAPGETIELSHASYSLCLHKPDRNLRAAAFKQYYQEFADHAQTLAATLVGSIQKDVYYAKARNHASAREASLFEDDVPVAVYDSLIAAVRKRLPSLHKYYDVRRRAMKLPDIRQYDTYVPILADLQTRYEWNEAVDLVVDSLRPLGAEYCDALRGGLRGRWCDKYENKGKRSGAFSSGAYRTDPFILMNYQPDVLDHVFTLTHEAGHSMHTYYSGRSQPFQYYSYTIFVAEVASTFNEQLLGDHLAARAADDRERAFIINRELDDMRGTIFRQTMFAEFEKIVHALAEAGEPLTLDRLKSEYRALLEAYFGPNFALDEQLDLECLRIPHFYSAFYVYKYATGMSAAIALAERVREGGRAELDDYLNFLKSGCSKFPLELLKGAGVDMTTPEPIDRALAKFDRLVDELDRLLEKTR